MAQELDTSFELFDPWKGISSRQSDIDGDSIEYTVTITGDDHESTTVTYTPERQSVHISCSDDIPYDEGKGRAIFGIIAIILIRSGVTLTIEL